MDRSGCSNPKSANINSKLHFRRTKVAEELLETEGSYVKNLSILIRKFQNPMLNSASSPKPLATDVETRTIFSSVEIIFSLNSMLLEGLNNKMRHWSSKQTIGDVFLYLGDFLKTYTDYINNYDSSQLMVLKCKDNNPRFAKFLEELQLDPVCHGQGLQSYLIMPVQRLPRYVLLLTELLKVTKPDQPDYSSLSAALSKIQNVAEYVNNKKREFEARFKLLEIAHSLSGKVEEIVQPHRQFIGSAEASWDIKGQKKGKGKLYIFNDALLICKANGRNNKVARLVLLKLFAAVSLGQGDDAVFQIITSDTKDTITLHFSDMDSRDAFYSTYTQAPNSIK